MQQHYRIFCLFKHYGNGLIEMNTLHCWPYDCSQFWQLSKSLRTYLLVICKTKRKISSNFRRVHLFSHFPPQLFPSLPKPTFPQSPLSLIGIIFLGGMDRSASTIVITYIQFKIRIALCAASNFWSLPSCYRVQCFLSRLFQSYQRYCFLPLYILFQF